MPLERVQKILAQAGIASRRKAEELISEGLVTINGRVAKLGDKADFSKDFIKVKGKLIHSKESLVYIAFHKPKGIISMMKDSEGRPSLSDYLSKIHARIFPIGRLDFNSEGLLLLTNDGDWAAKLQKRNNLARVYEVKVKSHLDDEQLEKLKRGGRVHGKLIQPASVKLVETLTSKSKVEVVFLESGGIDVKTFFEHKGFFVERMVRKSIGPVTLKDLPPARFRTLRKGEILALMG